MSVSLPTSGGSPFVTDGGLETDLIYNRGFDLQEFAAFPLVYDEHGRAALTDYYAGYADIARHAGVGLILATPTWRANPDWAERIGYDARATDRANRDAVALMQNLRDAWTDLPNVVVSGVIGPRGDGYVAGERPQVDEAADYHRAQIESFAQGGADLVEAITMTTPQEAAGIVRTANATGLPVGILFTVEIDGTLPDGSTLREAIAIVDQAGEAAYFGINCAHPTHIARALTDEDWAARIVELRPNASNMTHEELDAMTELDAGDISLVVSSLDALRAKLPGLSVVGGCCGTDARHVAGLWGQNHVG
ncbi:homocysteine S-methyltransferase family protein [Aeromicrobium sp.]|uniref:homocysteine S-methyltransferase family protein n=1 Tax=Aeromicrobium sp. TaxID=1871063 RepID=UPI0019B988FD|nr:homocysteine S-methyltransferase family protein [Aeromicrobium sp.]MBC7631370.1 homocysteine S-methyltransferase family protein [Aeromicrobium sp.]